MKTMIYNSLLLFSTISLYSAELIINKTDRGELLFYALNNNLSIPPANEYNCYPTLNSQGNQKPQTDPIASTFVANILKEPTQQNILEIGCAYGFLAQDILRFKTDKLKYTAIDKSKEHVAIATHSIAQIHQAFGHWNPIVGEFPNVNLPHNYFHHIALLSVIHFLTPQQLIDTVKKIANTLTSGGKAYFLTMHYTVPYYGPCIKNSYENKVKKAKPYPGFIKDMHKYAAKHVEDGTFDPKIAQRTNFANHYLFLDTGELVKIIQQENLKVDYATTIASSLYTNQPEPQQYVGIIASKR